MFYGCSNLLYAPVLSSMNLAENCYKQMFWQCASLQTAPILPATVVARGCYGQMFQGCSSLNYVKCMLSQNYYINNDVKYPSTYSWHTGWPETGTFVKAENSDWYTQGYNDTIPEGWTIETASE